MMAANHLKRNVVPSGPQPPPCQFYFAGRTCPWTIPWKATSQEGLGKP